MNDNTKLLKNLIEQMVSKEVKKQLPLLLHELLGKEDELPTMPQPSTNKPMRSSLMELVGGMETSKPQPTVTPRVTKQYTKNPMFNAILNQTVNDLSSREGGRAPSVSMDGNFSMTDMSEVGILNESIVPTQNISMPSAESVLDYKGKDAAVDNLMKWDFKAILEKSKKK